MDAVCAGSGVAAERARARPMLPEPPRPVERVALEEDVGETGASRPDTEYWSRVTVKMGASGSCEAARLMFPIPPRPVERYVVVSDISNEEGKHAHGELGLAAARATCGGHAAHDTRPDAVHRRGHGCGGAAGAGAGAKGDEHKVSRLDNESAGQEGKGLGRDLRAGLTAG